MWMCAESRWPWRRGPPGADLRKGRERAPDTIQPDRIPDRHRVEYGAICVLEDVWLVDVQMHRSDKYVNIWPFHGALQT